MDEFDRLQRECAQRRRAASDLLMRIRRLKRADVAQISRLCYETVHRVNSRDYDPEQIDAWAPRIYPDAFWQRRFRRYRVLVAEEEDAVVGFAELAIPDETIGQVSAVDLEIRDARPHELSATAAVLSRGMRYNPLHLFVFGPEPEGRERKLESFFRILLGWMPHPPWVGVQHGTIVAVCGMGEPGRCQPTLSQKLNIVAQLAHTCGVPSTLRALRWLGEWSLRDPKEAHWHLGPLCVDAPLQGRGIGSRLIGEWCRLLDAHRAAGYLETDKEFNADFYKKFGFQTIAEAKILGAPNWFMWRSGK